MCEIRINAHLPWSVKSSTDFLRAEASTNQVTVQGRGLVLANSTEGHWISSWHHWPSTVDSAELCIETEIDLFDNQQIRTVVQGAMKPYTDADGTQHTWYGTCMIVIVDENRWIMAIRSGVSHISWGNRDTIHLLTSATRDEPGVS